MLYLQERVEDREMRKLINSQKIIQIIITR